MNLSFKLGKALFFSLLPRENIAETVKRYIVSELVMDGMIESVSDTLVKEEMSVKKILVDFQFYLKTRQK